jgi:hypothetical protein
MLPDRIRPSLQLRVPLKRLSIPRRLDEAGDLLIPREPSALGLVVKDRRRVIVGDGDLEGG